MMRSPALRRHHPDDQLSRFQSRIVIAALSALAWGLLILIVISILKETLG